MKMPYSFLTKNFNVIEKIVARSRNPETARRPVENDPVRSLNHPIIEGPMNPPRVPMELMKASPPAAAIPVRKRVGIVQNMARADVMPLKATAMPIMEMTKEWDTIEITSPSVDIRHARVKFPIFFPLRSTIAAQKREPTQAKK